MHESPSQGTREAEKRPRYRRVGFDELLRQIELLPGVPKAAALPLTLLVFANFPLPRELKDWALAQIDALRAQRIWIEVRGPSKGQLLRIDGRIRRLGQALARPRFLAIKEEQEAEGPAKFFLVPDGTRKKAPELGALVVQAVDLLVVAFKRRVRYSSTELGRAARKGQTLVTAVEIVGHLLDLLGLRRTRARKGKLLRTRSRSEQGVLKEYQRQKRLLKSGGFWFQLMERRDGHRPTPKRFQARIPTPREIIRLCRRYRDKGWRRIGLNVPQVIWLPRR